MRFGLNLSLSVVLLVSAGCRDLAIPEQPEDGVVLGALDTSPIAPAGHAVSLTDVEGQRLSIATEPDGTFRFASVRPGLYALEVHIDGFAGLVVPNVRVRSGQTTDVGVLRPAFLQTSSATGFIQGRVTNAAGGAVLGTTVQFFLPSSTTPLTTAVADADGVFEARVTAGTWRLVARHPWYEEKTLEGVVVENDQTVDLRMTPLVLQIRPGTVKGAVKKKAEDGTLSDAVGAIVSLSTGSNTATTDGTGQYTLSGVVAGAHQLRVTLDSYSDPEGPRGIVVQPNAETIVDPITLELLTGAVRGTVETADGTAADGVTVALSPGGYGAVAATGQVNSSAQFVITGVPYGDYTAILNKAGYFRATTQVRVNAPQVAVPNVVLAPQSGDFVIDDDDPDNTPTYARSPAVKLVFISAANAAEMRISEDQNFTGATFQAYQNNFPRTLSAGEGLKTLFVQLKDSNGTVGPTLSATVTVDLSPPAAPIVILDSTGVSSSGVKFTSSTVTLPLRVIASDGLSGVKNMRLSGSSTLVMGQLVGGLGRYESDTSFTRQVTTDGPQTVFAQVIDNAGNVSAIGSDSIIVDHALPVGGLSIRRGPDATLDGYTNQALVEVDFTTSAEPDGGSVQVKLAHALGPDLDGASYQTARTSSWLLDVSTQGAKQLWAVFRDTAGNVSAPVSASITYDTTPPSPVSASISPAVSRVSAVSVSTSSSATDLSLTEGVTVSENPTFTAAGTQGPGPLASAVPLTLSAGDGPRTVYVRFKDHAGNTSIATTMVTLDQTPPPAPAFALVATGTRGTQKFSSVGTALPFTLTGVDSLSGVTHMRLSTSSVVDAQGRLSAVANTPWASSGTFARAAGDGPVTVYAQLLDAAGNASAVVSDTITVDTVVPSGSITIARGTAATVDGFTNEGVVNVSLNTSAEPHGGTLSFKLANSNGPALTQAAYRDIASATTWLLDTGSEGPKSLYAVFRDSAGNESAPVNTSITYDVTPPSPVSASITPAVTRLTAVSVALASSAVDLSPTEGVTVSENSTFTGAGTQGPAALTASVPLTLSAGDGARTVYVRFKDKAGNTALATAVVTLDQAPPPAPSFALVATGTRGSQKFTNVNGGASLPYTLTGVDALSGVTHMRVSSSNAVDAQGRLSAVANTTWAASGTFARAASDATVTLYAQLLDAAGNASPVVSDSITVDTQLPSGTLGIARGSAATVDGYTNEKVVNVGVSAPAEPNGGAVTFKLANSNGIALTQAPYQELTSATSWFLDTATEGPKTLYAVFRDSAGNESSPVSANITYDVTGPTPATASITPGTTRVNGVVVAVASSAVDLSPTHALTLSESSSFTGSAASVVGPQAMPGGGTVNFTLSGGGDGLRTVYVRFRDRAGNDTVVPAAVTLDQSPPSGTIDLTGVLADGLTTSSSLTASTDVTVALRVTGATEYFLGAAGLSTCPSVGYTPMPVNGLVTWALAGGAAGAREVRGCFRDAAGNVLGGPAGTGWAPSASITYDATPPTSCALTATGSMRSGAAAPVGKTALTRISVAVSGCAGAPQDIALVAGSVTCTTSASLPWQRYGTALSFTLPNQDGLTQINACVRDLALNTGSVTGTSLTLDTQPPTGAVLTIASLNGSGYSPTISPQVSGQADDAVTWGLAAGSTGPFSVLAYAGTPSVTTFNFGASGARSLYGVFVDDVGNASAPVRATVTIDTTPPPIPRFYSVDVGNRGAHLFWDGVADASGILRYELWCGTSAATAVCGTVAGAASDGWVLNLANRRDQVFAVQAVDLAGNVSGLSGTLTGAVGFRRINVPFSSAYSVIPLDVATRGDDIYLTYSERDADWTVTSGNLRIAVSNDRGLTWRFAPLDSAFGWDRRFGHIAFTDTAVVVGTIGTAQAIDGIFASTAWPDRGQVRLYTSQNSGTSWEETAVTGLSTNTNWAATSGLGMWTSGQRLGLHYRLGSNNDLRMVYASSGGPFAYLSGSPYFTPSVTAEGLKSCAGNYSLVHAWKNGTGMQSVTHYFYNQVAVNTGAGEGTYQTVTSGVGAGLEVNDFDLACVGLPEATQAYVVYLGTSGNQLYLRRKLTASGSWGGASTIISDADRSQAPRIWAGSRNVYVLYRNTSNEVVLAESLDEGATFAVASRARLERGASAGFAPVLSGETSSDVAAAFTDSTGTSLTVLVPALPAVKSVASPGLTASRLTWTPVSGVDRYQVALGTAPNVTTDVNYSSVVSYDVPSAVSPMYYSVRAVDAQGMPGNDGPVWQSQPLAEVTVIPTVITTGATSNTGGIVAYNQNAVLLPPYGERAAADSDLTVYRTSNGGQTWAAHTPPTPVATGTARALAGLGNKMVLLYRQSAAVGLRARIYPDMMAATGPAETLLDGTMGADLIAARADPANGRLAVAYVNSATDQIRTASWNNALNTFTLGTVFTVPNAGATTLIEAIDVVKVDGGKTVLTWRQQYTDTAPNPDIEYQQIYEAESADGLTFSAPVLVTNGTLTQSYDNYYVGQSTIVSGSANSAYTVWIHANEQSLAYGRGDNLYLTVSGTDLSTAGYTKFVIDRDLAVANSMDSVSNADGHYFTYTTVEAGGSQNRLKLAYCATDCHLAANWRRTILKTFPSTNANGVLLGVAEGANPLLYVAYRYYTGASYELRVMRGGVNRWVR